MGPTAFPSSGTLRQRTSAELIKLTKLSSDVWSGSARASASANATSHKICSWDPFTIGETKGRHRGRHRVGDADGLRAAEGPLR